MAESETFPIAGNGQAAAVIVVPASPRQEENSAANELAVYLKKLTGAEFQTVAEDKAPSKPQIHVGWTRQSLEAIGPPEKLPLDADGIIIRTLGRDRLLLLGRSPWGAELAVYRFLHLFGGVRWYMPTEVGEHVPSKPDFAVPMLNITESPDWLSRLWSAADRADKGEWNKRNLIRSRFSFHHYLNVWMQPSLYDEHPDWFPLRKDGKRYRPRQDDHSWQPCFSSAEVAGYVAKRIIETFDKNPALLSASIGVNDSGWQGYCQCEGCKALDISGKMSLHRGPDYSNRFFTFANRVAEEVAAKYPDRYLGCLAYNACENPPTFKVHPMIIPYLTNDRAQWRDRKFAKADRDWIGAWRAVCPSVATYTYEYGSGYVIPRVYFRLQKQYMDYCKAQGIKGWYAEIYCNWMLDGPKAWLGSQLLWDNDQKLEDLLDDFYGNFYGPARKPMRRYFEFCERQWMNQKGDAVWFRYFFDPKQLELFPLKVCRTARKLLDEAMALATAEPYCRRVDLTSKAFHITELYSAVYHAGHVPSEITTATQAEEILETVATGLRAEQERQKYLVEVVDKEPLLKPAIPFDGRGHFSPSAASPALLWQLFGWCRENQREDIAEKLLSELSRSDQTGDVAAVARTMWRLPSMNLKNLITNGSFEATAGPQGDTSGVDWNSEGAPPGWSFWERNPGAGKLRWISSEGEQYVTLAGVKGACYLQTVPVIPGSVYFVVADYRGQIGASAKASLVMSWKDANGAWADEFRRATDLVKGVSPRWRSTAVVGRAPEKAATAIVMLFADDQKNEDTVAFDNVKMFEAKARD